MSSYSCHRPSSSSSSMDHQHDHRRRRRDVHASFSARRHESLLASPLFDADGDDDQDRLDSDSDFDIGDDDDYYNTNTTSTATAADKPNSRVAATLEFLPATTYRPPPLAAHSPRPASAVQSLSRRPQHSVDLLAPVPGDRPAAQYLQRPARSTSLDSPLPTPFSPGAYFLDSYESPQDIVPRDLDRFPHGHTPDIPREASPDASQRKPLPPLPSLTQLLQPRRRPSLDHHTSSYHTAHDSLQSRSSDANSAGSGIARIDNNNNNYNNDAIDDDDNDNDNDNDDSSHNASQVTAIMATGRKSPNLQVDTNTSAAAQKPQKSPMSALFGWKSKPKDTDSPTTQFSSDSRPISPMPSPLATSPGPSAPGRHQLHDDEGYSGPANGPSLTYGEQVNMTRVDELVRELEEVSAELAHSIQREMELEDEVERYRTEMPAAPPSEANRRTSDYFSDSGASSMRAPLDQSETKIEYLETMRRKVEQEKAQLRVDLANRTQEDINQRKALELHIQTLEGQVRLANFAAGEPTDKEKELEASLADTTRKLGEEKAFKDNFEDLLAGMRQEIEAHRNERDNLRDEVVPQLKSRVEGLEAEAAKSQPLQYEVTRLQQELDTLKNENQSLHDARKMGMDMAAARPRIKGVLGAAGGDAALQRSGSQKAKEIPLDQMPAYLKDVEDQRDALHLTLKNMILRQHQMSKTYKKQVRLLEGERDRAVSETPRRAAFAVEVLYLRKEVNTLRRRADDALEQKWQCEKGLSGIKMDLDRAQQETTSLRDLLKEHDIFLPDSAAGGEAGGAADSLDKAYSELQQAQQRAQGGRSNAEAALRLEQLSGQVSSQLTTNQQLRARLAEAIGRGEKEQGAAAQKIVDLQQALKVAEERLAAAQAISEEAIATQEEHVRQVKEVQTQQQMRGVSAPHGVTVDRSGGNNNNSLTPNWTPHSPFSAHRQPRPNKRSPTSEQSAAEASKTAALEKQIREMEQAALQAESEMQGVVEAMNRAQIEVGSLQAERDEATRQTRRLQREILLEREKVAALAS